MVWGGLTPRPLPAGLLLSGLTLMLLSSVVNAFMRSTWLFTVRPPHRLPAQPEGRTDGHLLPPTPSDTDTGLPPSDVPVSLPQANLYLGLMLMCGFVLFDTQLIIEKAESGDKDYIWWVLARGGGGGHMGRAGR